MLKYIILIFLLQLPFVGYAQSTFAPKFYVGSSQFFDISGEWINENKDTTRRIDKLEIYTTIVNTYRAVPYFSLGGGESFPTQEVQLVVSEREMAYVTNILEAKCMIMPVIINGQQKLRVYSIIVNPAGTWLGVVTDLLVRKNASATTSSFNTLQPNDMIGYWINEWKENQSIPKIQIFKNTEGKMIFKIFRMIAEKAKPIGEFPITKETPDHTQIIEWKDGELITKFNFRPEFLNNKLAGFDLIIEEVYADGTPRNIFRQFFTKDMDSKRIMETEILVAKLEGEWVNTDYKSPTKKLTIYDGEVELFNVSSETTTGIQSLGKQALKPADDEQLKAIIPNLFSIRTVEIDVKLDINKQFKDAPAVMVVTATIEDRAGEKEPYMYTEVFRRKNANITPQMLGIK